MSRLVNNDSVTRLNRRIRMFPTSLVAGMMGFDKRDYPLAAEVASPAAGTAAEQDKKRRVNYGTIFK